MSNQIDLDMELQSIDAEDVVEALQPKIGNVAGEHDVDSRLRYSNIRDVAVRLSFKDGSTLDAYVYSLTRYDVIIRLPKDSEPIKEQMVLFELSRDGEQTQPAEGLLHWNGETVGGQLVGVFAAELIPRSFSDVTTPSDRRGEIRYPMNINAVVRGPDFREDCRIVDYSLNGLGLEVPRPMELDRRYEATFKIGEQLIKLPMLCCFNARSEEGGGHEDGSYLVGVGLRCHEGAFFAHDAFELMENGNQFMSVSPRFPALNHVSGRGEAAASTKMNAAPYEVLVSWFSSTADAIDERLTDRPVISRTSIAILASMLLGMSIQASGKVQLLTFLFGVFGVLAYYGLAHAFRLNERKETEEQNRIKREIAERRLQREQN